MSWTCRPLRVPLRRTVPSPRCIWQWFSQQRYSSVHASELQFGQPLHETHPHLIGAGELTPGITALEYYERRKRLAELLPANSVAIIAGSDLRYRSGTSAAFYEFHQDPEFLYLTGFLEPEALAVIEKRGQDANDAVFHLFVRSKNEREELWEGARSGVQAALDVFNADEASDISRLEKELPKLVKGAANIFTDLPKAYQPKSAFSRYVGAAALRPKEGIAKVLENNAKPLRPLLNQLRARKTEAEVNLMRGVGRVCGRAFTAAMKQQFLSEKDLQRYLEHEFKSHGMDGVAYIPVVAGGSNALSIHYVRNDHLLKDGDLVLVDAGGQMGGYITDITRTWPVNGKFTDAQKDLYEAVLTAQRKGVAMCSESNETTLDKVHDVVEAQLKDNLKQIGFDTSTRTMSTLYPHHVGHYIGLDVHDSPGFPRTEVLKSGHCITVEPGIYVPNDDRWPAHFRGMGVRIEDSVCVDKTAPLNLSVEAVKEVVDIEALRR